SPPGRYSPGWRPRPKATSAASRAPPRGRRTDRARPPRRTAAEAVRPGGPCLRAGRAGIPDPHRAMPDARRGTGYAPQPQEGSRRMPAMLRTVLVLLLGLPAAHAQASAPLQLQSPDGRNSVTFELDADGAPLWSVARDGQAVIAPSPLGVRLGGGEPI